jgi:polar amino acid transport system permease protein
MLSAAVFRNIGFLLLGFKTSIYVSLLCLVSASTVGIGTALLLLSRPRPFRIIAGFYIDLFRSTPPLIQLVWFYYALPILIGHSMTSLQAGVLGLTLYQGSYMAEIFRGGMMSIQRGQVDAAFALGMTPWQAFRTVVLPQAVIRMLPPLTGQTLTLFKDSSILSVIAVPELLWQAENLIPLTLHRLEIFTLAAMLYFLIGFPLSLATNRLYALLTFD